MKNKKIQNFGIWLISVEFTLNVGNIHDEDICQHSPGNSQHNQLKEKTH